MMRLKALTLAVGGLPRCPSPRRRWRRRSTTPGATDTEIKIGNIMPY